VATPPRTTIGIRYVEVANANPHAEGIVARQAELLETHVDSPIFAPKA
jgi:hypothetical protein